MLTFIVEDERWDTMKLLALPLQKPVCDLMINMINNQETWKMKKVEIRHREIAVTKTWFTVSSETCSTVDRHLAVDLKVAVGKINSCGHLPRGQQMCIWFIYDHF